MTIATYFESDRVRLIKPNEIEYDNVKAGVLTDVILSAEDKPFDVGDQIMRTLPNGVEEVYDITKVDFSHRIGRSIPPHYCMSFKKQGVEDKKMNDKQPSIMITGAVHGDVSGSTSFHGDTKIHREHNQTAQNGSAVFGELSLLLDRIENSSEKLELLRVARELEEARNDKWAFYDKYKEFLSVGANHMSLLAPAIPGLLLFMP